MSIIAYQVAFVKRKNSSEDKRIHTYKQRKPSNLTMKRFLQESSPKGRWNLLAGDAGKQNQLNKRLVLCYIQRVGWNPTSSLPKFNHSNFFIEPSSLGIFPSMEFDPSPRNLKFGKNVAISTGILPLK